MLTRRGWGMLAGAGALATAGRLFGLPELYWMAAAAICVVVAGLAFVHLRAFSLGTSRHLRPSRVHAGSDSRVELTVTNTGSTPSPVLSVRDPFDRGRRSARFLLAPLAPGETARATYRLPTESRGVFDLGPLSVSLADPFRVAATHTRAASPTRLTVYPPIDSIPPLPHTRGQDPHGGSERASTLDQTGEEFYALRPYETGDDLRRVHWPSTARHDELMIRQDQMPWQARATVLLDLRRAVHPFADQGSASLDLAVSAAASIFAACWRRGSLVRLVTTAGTDSGFGADQAHRDAIFEHLATVGPEVHDRLHRVLAALRGSGNGGALAVVTTAALPGPDLERLARLEVRHPWVALVLFERSSWDPSPAARRLPPRQVPPGFVLVRVDAATPFAEAWPRALAPRVAEARR